MDNQSKVQLIEGKKAVIADMEALLKETANTCGEKFAVIRSKVEESIKVAKASIEKPKISMVA